MLALGKNQFKTKTRIPKLLLLLRRMIRYDKAAADSNPLNMVPSTGPPNDDLAYEDVKATPVFSNCCCCICQCSDSVTKDEVCCFFVPLKAGVTFIAIFTVILIAW
jgi:hypothetical protein